MSLLTQPVMHGEAGIFVHQHSLGIESGICKYDRIQTSGIYSANRENCFDGVPRIALIIFDAREAFLAGAGNNLAIHKQRCGGVCSPVD